MFIAIEGHSFNALESAGQLKKQLAFCFIILNFIFVQLVIKVAQIIGGISDAFPCLTKEKIQTSVILLDIYQPDA